MYSNPYIDFKFNYSFKMKLGFILLVLVLILVSSVNALLKDDLIHYYTYDGGNANDLIGSNNGVVNGATLTNTSCIYGSCYSYDGLTNYINYSDMGDLDTFTVCYFVRPLTTDSYDNSFSSQGDTQNNGLRVEEFQGAYYSVRCSVNNVDSYNEVSISNDFNPQIYQSLCFIWSSASERFLVYQNETLKNNVSLDKPSIPFGEVLTGVGFINRFFDGNIDNLAIWERELTSSEVSAYHTQLGVIDIGNASLSLNSNLVNGKSVYSYVTETIYFNGTVTGTPSLTVNCSLIVNNVINQTKEVADITVTDSFIYNYGFTYGYVNFSINCSNSEIADETNTYSYNVDTTRIILYTQSLNIQATLDNFMEGIEFLSVVIMYLGLYFLGYKMIVSYNVMPGLILTGSTTFFEVYFVTYFFDKLGINISDLGAMTSWQMNFVIIFFFGFLFILASKIIVLMSMRWRNKEGSYKS